MENFEDFKGLTDRPSSEFLQFAKSFLSFDKADKANNPAFKSCLLRVPYTFNSKCIAENINPEVKIVEKFDESKPLPNIDNLLVEFMTFLADRKLKRELKMENSININSKSKTSLTIYYIEKLLEIGLRDYRKYAINLIFTPYFVNILKLSDEESFNRIKEWVLKCDDINH